jgi:hypothetical protein
MRALLPLLLLLIFISTGAEARWATLDDVALEAVFHNQNITVESSGAYKTVAEVRTKVLKESGREQVAHFTMYYSSPGTLKVLEAKTIVDGKEYVVDAALIEDQPLASSPQGFDQQRQVLISFPKVEVGAEIYLKYEETEPEPILDNFFSKRLFYASSGCTQDATMKIDSKLPLQYEVNDPKNVLQVTGDKERLVIKLRKPVCNEVAAGSEIGSLNVHSMTWVSLSSAKDWQQLGAAFAPGYERVVTQELPAYYQSIVRKAAATTSEIERINTVTSMLNERVQYMGDWRSVAGRFFPRDLSVIDQSQIGDCKDFASSTVAMLRYLGFQASVSLVMRGETNKAFNSVVPNANDFNHAFVKAISVESGTVYWIDPTNPMSMAQDVFPDIAGRMALVLDKDNPTYTMSAAVDPVRSGSKVDVTMNINGAVARSTGVLTLSGSGALPLTAVGLYASEQTISDLIFRALSGTYLSDKEKLSLELPDLRARTVADLTFKFDYEQSDRIFKTNMGPGIELTDNWVDSVVSSAPDQVADLSLGLPRSIQVARTFTKQQVRDIETLDCELDTKWIYFKRSGSHISNDGTVAPDTSAVVKDAIIIKQPFIDAKDLQSEEYVKLRDTLLRDYKKATLVLG